MDSMDLVLVGHFALDTIIIRTPFSESHSLGGGVTYGSLAASFFDPKARVGIVSRVAHNFDHSYLSIFNEHKIDLGGIIFEGESTTSYLLDYHDNVRDLRLLAKAPNMKLSDFPRSFINAKAIHMTPIADEFTPEFLEKLANHELTQDTLIGIDVQGMIRGFDKDGNILMKTDKKTRDHIFKMMKRFGSRMFFKASDKEAQAVANEQDLEKATIKLGETGAYIFTTLGAKGLFFKAPGKPILHLPAYKPKESKDETGAGDCFMAVLLLQLSQKSKESRDFDNIVEAAKIASSASSFLIEEKGPHGFQNRNIVLERVKNGLIIR